MTRREILEMQVLCWWAANLKNKIPELEFFEETDFLPENRNFFNLLLNTKAEGITEILPELNALNRIDYSELIKMLSDSAYLPEGYIVKRIEELKNLGSFDSLQRMVRKTIKELEESHDSFNLAYSLEEIAKHYITGLDKLNPRNSQKYKSLQWLESLDKPIEFFRFPEFPFMETLKIQRGHVIVLSGLFKSGKTSVALAFGFEQERQGEKFGYISAEMTMKEIHEKFFSYRFNIPSWHFTEPGKLHPHDKKLIHEYIMEDKKLYRFDIETKLTLGTVKRLIEKHARLGIRFITLDYYQRILLTNGRYKSREEELSYISNKLVEYAKEYEVCLIVISQMNRGAFTNANSGNMAGSLALNRDADFLFNMLKPTDNIENKNKSSIKIDGEDVYFDKHDFLLELERSRHSRGGATALLTRERSGRMLTKWENFSKALDYDYDNTVKVPLLGQFYGDIEREF